MQCKIDIKEQKANVPDHMDHSKIPRPIDNRFPQYQQLRSPET